MCTSYVCLRDFALINIHVCAVSPPALQNMFPGTDRAMLLQALKAAGR